MKVVDFVILAIWILNQIVPRFFKEDPLLYDSLLILTNFLFILYFVLRLVEAGKRPTAFAHDSIEEEDTPPPPSRRGRKVADDDDEDFDEPVVVSARRVGDPAQSVTAPAAPAPPPVIVAPEPERIAKPPSAREVASHRMAATPPTAQPLPGTPARPEPPAKPASAAPIGAGPAWKADIAPEKKEPIAPPSPPPFPKTGDEGKSGIEKALSKEEPESKSGESKDKDLKI